LWITQGGDREPLQQLCADLAGKTVRHPTWAFMPELSPLIKILNPLRGGAPFVGYQHARRYIRQGRAEWVGSRQIRFVDQDHRHQSAARLLRTQTACGYDGRGMLLLCEIKRLPCVNAEQLLVGKKCLR
jgi:hypothetical protein